MRIAILLLFALPSLTAAQMTTDEKKATIAFIMKLHDPATGGYRVDAKTAPGLRATSGAVRSFNYLGGDKLGLTLPNQDKTDAFVNSCYDMTTGSFHEPQGQPDVTITSVGVMTAAELGLLKLQWPRSAGYLHANAKSFEEVRIAAAALESAKLKPTWLDEWIKIADAQLNNDGTAGKSDGQSRDTASVAAMKLRLGYPVANKVKVVEAIVKGQRADGGWGKANAKDSDLETSYRVMRALHLLKDKPKDTKALKAFLAKCRNPDGGYSVERGKASTLSGVYYASAISKWMER